MTETQTPPLPAPKMPKLDKSRVDPNLAGLSPAWKKRVEARKVAFARAVKTRSEADSFTAKALEEARRKDHEALVEGSQKKPPTDPGRDHEMNFLRSAQEAHRQAAAATTVSNTATVELRRAMAEAGPDPSEVHERLRALDKKKREHAEALIEIVSEADAVRSLRQSFRRIEKGHSFQAIPSGSTSPLEIPARGQGLPAAVAASQIADLDLWRES